ncbi:knotted1 induced1 [Dorcoceras hygrometricum]|uniref:Knotted1 induced1 n=1 Tax=Dorcoceras hygrometricum TaxID=472368 RepID=A0A2Z7A4D2_9LAMI|nr:knotted1 induced1 [Dorcoceras hygrometricum]
MLATGFPNDWMRSNSWFNVAHAWEYCCYLLLSLEKCTCCAPADFYRSSSILRLFLASVPAGPLAPADLSSSAEHDVRLQLVHIVPADSLCSSCAKPITDLGPILGPITSRAARDRSELNPRRNQPSRHRRSIADRRPPAAAATTKITRGARPRTAATSAAHDAGCANQWRIVRPPSSHNDAQQAARSSGHPLGQCASSRATMLETAGRVSAIMSRIPSPITRLHARGRRPTHGLHAQPRRMSRGHMRAGKVPLRMEAYGPFNPYIPIRSKTIGKSRVAKDPIAMHTSWRSNSDIASVTSIGYPCMSASGESSTTMHRLLHASGPHPIPPPNDPNRRPFPPPKSRRRRHVPPEFVSANLDEENPSAPISSGLLVQADEGVSHLVVDLIDVVYRHLP